VTYRALALVVLAGAIILGGMSGFLFARGATWEGAGVFVAAFALVLMSAYTATAEGRR
jgi:hypothetical protein